MIEHLRETYRRLLAETTTQSYRYLFDSFEVGDRLVGLVGPRGVGKTTLLLQYIRDCVSNPAETFYASADHIYFNKIGLLEFVRELYTMEGTRLFFFDEIHKYPRWEQELKNIHDSFPAVRVVFSGSSSLCLTKGSYDLSRRASIYRLQGLSFREYLNLRTGTALKPVSLDMALSDPEGITASLSEVPKLLGVFRNYLQEGYYPYVLEGSPRYYDKILTVLEKTIYEDIGTHYHLKTENLHHFKKALYFLATIPPGDLNVHKLGSSLGVDDKTALNYLQMLQDAGLVRTLLSDARGHALLRAPAKMFLDNTTLYHAICQGLGQPVDIGTARELFFLTSVQNAGQPVFRSEQGGDFRIGDCVFEVGGRGKSGRQISKSAKRGFVVKDDVLVGSKLSIPLYLLGFLY